ncbi:MAG: hypothetical protein LBR10_16385 [Prevotellaceae bacterium]|jgi:hypothetical protein|nr:hypothetical protein [Prevotellaceae bacterium]
MKRKIDFYAMIIMTILLSCACSSNSSSPQGVAKQFFTAFYSGDVATAKTFMTKDGARRTPDRLTYTDEESKILLDILKHAQFKVYDSEYESIKTVRIVDAKGERIRAISSVEMVYIGGIWKITTYGY